MAGIPPIDHNTLYVAVGHLVKTTLRRRIGTAPICLSETLAHATTSMFRVTASQLQETTATLFTRNYCVTTFCRYGVIWLRNGLIRPKRDRLCSFANEADCLDLVEVIPTYLLTLLRVKSNFK